MTTPPAGGEEQTTTPRKTIDLDAARAARREQRTKDGAELAPVVRVNGKEYPLPAEIPAETVHAFGVLFSMDASSLKAGDLSTIGPAMATLSEGMEALFGASWKAIHDDAMAAGDPLSFQDEVFLLEEAMGIYGMALPESSASDRS